MLLLLSKEFLEAHAALYQYAEVSRLSDPTIGALEDIDFSEMFDENDVRAENIPSETRETEDIFLFPQQPSDLTCDAEYFSLLQARLFPSFSSEITSGSLALEASPTSSPSTVQTELHSPKHAQGNEGMLTTPDPSGVQQLQGSRGEARRSKKCIGPFQPRSPRLSSRANVELGEQKEQSSAQTSLSARPSQKVSKPLPAGMQWKEDVYEPAWEGTMFAKHEGRLVLVSKAQAYKIKSAPEGLTAGWSRLLMAGNIIPQASVDRSYAGQAHDLIFEVKDDGNIHNLLNKNELCIRYGLPTQSLIITPSEHNHLTGKVYAGEGPSVHSSTTSADQHNQ